MDSDATEIQTQARQADGSDDLHTIPREALMLLIEATVIEMLLDLVAITCGSRDLPPEAPVAPLVERFVET